MDKFSLARVRTMLPSLPNSISPLFVNDEAGDEVQEEVPSNEQDDRVLPMPAESPTAVEPRPLTPEERRPKSNLDLINECDSFPYRETHPALYYAHTDTYYHLQVAAYPDVTLGYILPSVAEVLRGLPDWSLDDDNRTLTLTGGSDAQERTRIVAGTTAAMRATGHYVILKGWRDELYPVYGPKKDLLFSIERAASALFGIVTYGCHMTAYTLKSKSIEEGKEESEMAIWVPRRAKTKSTYGGMLDNTVAGGLATGEQPFEGMVREAAEEASLPEELVRAKTLPAGSVTYFHIRDERAGGETKLLQPEVQYVYDLQLPEDVVPKPNDDEVEGFELMSIDTVKEAMRDGQFKPNCALVLLDFFVRHGILGQHNEEDYLELVSRLHRRSEFPTR